MSEVKAVQDYANHILNNAESYGIVQVKDNEVHLKSGHDLELFAMSSEAKKGETYEVFVKGNHQGKLKVESDLYYRDGSIKKDISFQPDLPLEYITVDITLEDK